MNTLNSLLSVENELNLFLVHENLKSSLTITFTTEFLIPKDDRIIVQADLNNPGKSGFLIKNLLGVFRIIFIRRLYLQDS